MTTGGRRRGDADRSRAALLGAARELFGAHGYDHTTVRAIAERAGVNQALLFRYFGSKDALFAAALGEEGRRLAASAGPEDLLAETLRRLFTSDDDGTLRAVLRSPEHPSALAALQEELAEPYRRALASRSAVPGADADLRADLVLAWLLGLGFARTVLGLGSLVEADPDAVAAHVDRAVRALFADGPDGPDGTDGAGMPDRGPA